MSLDGKEFLSLLLQQIHLDEDPLAERLLASGASLDKVKVNKDRGLWNFTIQSKEILNAGDFKDIDRALKGSFQSIAHPYLTVQADDKAFDEDLLLAYWRLACQRSGIDSPLCRESFEKDRPKMDQGRILFPVANDVLLAQYDKQFLPQVAQAYQDFGFPPFKIQAYVDKSLQEAPLEDLKDRRARLEEESSKKALDALLDQEEKREDQQKAVGLFRLGRSIPEDTEITRMEAIFEEERQKTIEGYVFDVEIVDLRSGRQLLQIKMTDYSSSFMVKRFSNTEEDKEEFKKVHEGMWLRVRGSIQEDTYYRDLVMMANDLVQVDHEPRLDLAPEGKKRVELHAHTTMSMLDATNSAEDIIKQAAAWGHEAVAITDSASVQAFPEAYAASKDHGIKVLYGMEIYLIDDGAPIAYNASDIDLLDAEFVAFDVETTGLSAVYDNIIELSGVRMHKGNIIKEFEEFIDPGRPIPQNITELTGITDDMVKGSRSETEVVKDFMDFADGAILVAHNASFDMGFLNKALEAAGEEEISQGVIDTLEFSRFLHPNQARHGLARLTKQYDITLDHHHRAIYDAQATAYLGWKFINKAVEEHGKVTLADLNVDTAPKDGYKNVRPTRATVYAQNEVGLKNLYKLSSIANVEYYYRTPRVPRSELIKYRDGLLVGSSDDEGEVYQAMLSKGYSEALEKAKFYDFLEVQPLSTMNRQMDQENLPSQETMKEITKQIVQMGEELDKKVVATGNVHYLNPEDYQYREILLDSQAMTSTEGRHSQLHFRTTDEMLEDFDFLGEELAHQIVVDNSQYIADQIEDIAPIKDSLYTPKIEGAEEEIRDSSYAEARRLFGDDLPEIVEKRIEKELSSIIGNGFAVIYLISKRLVHKSNDDGYIVGSRGSVGSSFVATLQGITEVNPMEPHYRCPECKHSEWFTEGEVKSGFDLEDKACPHCGTPMVKDGHNIPFETFLGFTGNKVPDIDLNFSGEYQAEAHRYTKELFGEDYVYRAGTIGTIQSKTAFGYVKAYERENNKTYRNAEVDRLTKGLEGVKRTTGQHPGGIVVVPADMDVYDFTPVQYPADDSSAEWKTTHFDFHSIEDNILKLDILGHDDPTTLRKIQDLTGVDPRDIPLDDPDVMTIFSSTDALDVTPEQIGTPVGTYGVPEFGTPFVRGMLEQTQPKTFSDLLQISGLSHGTDVYLGNAEVLIRDHGMDLSEVIGCRDDIMVDLMQYGVEDETAFNIMEHVRKGRGIPDDWQADMRAAGVPEWYIDSCLKIKYMFPKAHAAAYIINALRIAYFKVHQPLVFYSTYFTVRANDFDIEAMVDGPGAVKARIQEIKAKGMDASNKEKALQTELEVANEMLERGYSFQLPDIEKSHATDFVIEGKSLIFPFRAIPSLGVKVAQKVVEERDKQAYLSKEDLMKRGGVSKTVVEYMSHLGILDGMSDENQLSLFDSL